MSNEGIAIIGIDCRYPGAHNPEQYWENILAWRQQFRRIPDKRLNLDHYYAADKSKVDYTYSRKASVLSGYHFDRLKYRVAKSTFEQTDLTHWLALDVAAGALKDAGFENGAELNKERVGVVLGNSLTGEFTRSNLMRGRWPYVSGVLETTLKELRYSKEDISTIIRHAEKTYKDPFPEPDADMLAGGLSNTIAGRICNYFDFHGGGFTVDGACSSSLLAFSNACTALVNGDLDLALAGGVDLSIDPFEIIGFARNGALAAHEMDVYSAKAEGFWPGEGCGIVVLMREKEARERGLNINAVIQGWGISSDGNGGITRPKSDTQQIAYERAYTRAGYDIDSVTLFEGHGTGTTLGDQVELTALINALRDAGKQGTPAALGSVKQLIGHTKAAAGVAGAIKATLALKHGTIPAFRPVSQPHKILTDNKDILSLPPYPTQYTGKTPMRASVASMGFGGINVHITLQEASEARRPKKISGKVTKLATSRRDTEVFPLSAASKEAFEQTLQRLQAVARDISRAEFTDLSATLCASYQHAGNWKASLVAANPDVLAEGLAVLQQAVEEGKEQFVEAEKGVYFNRTGKKGNLAFLFPGQGSPVYADAGAFSYFNQQSAYPVQLALQGEIVDTAVAQPVIVQNTLQSLELMEQLGVEARWGIGHSLGEISALGWAGVIDPTGAVELATARGKAMSELGEKGGTMLALKCTAQELHELIDHSEVCITGYNGTGNYVVGGSVAAVEEVQERASERGIHAVRLKVSHAFHTPMMKGAASHFQTYLASQEFSQPDKAIVSTVTGHLLSETESIADLLYKQIEAPVQLTQAVDKIKSEADFLIELGPGNALTRSLKDYPEFTVLALDYGSSSFKGLLHILSAAHISGNEIRFEELSCNRFYRPFDLENWNLDVLINPCELNGYKTSVQAGGSEEAISAVQQAAAAATASPAAPVTATDTPEGVEAYLKKIISEKLDIPFELIGPEDRIMSQLHINSLAITEIISLTIKAFNRSQKVLSQASIAANGDGTIHELGVLIYNGEAGNNTPAADKGKVFFDLVPNWTAIFQRRDITKKLPKVTTDRGVGKITVAGIKSLAAAWEENLAAHNIPAGNGAVYVYSAANGRESLADFVSFLNQPSVRQGAFVVLVDLYGEQTEGDLRPLLRTFQQEVPGVAAMSLELSNTLEQPQNHLAAELKSVSRYKEVKYDAQGIRTESEWESFTPQPGKEEHVIEPGDVILATGGGKGITFESAYDLALRSGARLAILGRSNPELDRELSRNLQRLAEAAIPFRYYPADVCDAAAVKQAIASAAQELGAIRIILHGAGINRPKPLALLTAADFEQTEKVKVAGLRNVMEALDPASLKLLIGYGSIIAQSGMMGNGDYAWANDQLAIYINELSVQHPHCRCLTLEWSVWAETGMGVTLNSVEALRSKGVWPIPVKQGLTILQQMVADAATQGRYLISGRYGDIPTLNYTKKQLPLGRFVSKIRHHVPGVEIVSDVSINLNDDVYLKNHVFKNQYVFPTVMILEGMAQVCSALHPAPDAWKFDGLQIHKSIVVPKGGSNIIRFIVTRLSAHEFRAVAQSEDSSFSVNCFETTISFGPAPLFMEEAPAFAQLHALDFNVGKKFYDDLLFHHGPFRRIHSFLKIDALESVAKADSSLNDSWFGAYMPGNALLGDPGLNDAAIHCHQACRPGSSLLPTGAGQIVINNNPVPGPFFIKTRETREEKNTTVIDVCVINAQGEIKQYWKDLTLTQVAGTAFTGRWDPHLLVPFIEYKLMKLAKTRSIRLPLNNCLDLVKSLASNKRSESCRVDDYSICLSKGKSTREGSAPQLSLELALAGVEEPVVLEIV
ncbi:MAG: SDR family NAD(P)-dependent oxidoreductase [Williamsia sp.]|nr:SDR family NAD(P)-dependent oxidoreductase [Williamsia sp.]